MDIFETVKALCETDGASGNESPAALLALSMLKRYCPDAGIVSGNVIGSFNTHRDDLPTLVLDAHIDQIGMIVTHITDEGFIKVGNLGGIDRRLLPAQPVIIHGKSDIPGVVCSVPPHLLSGDSGVMKWDEVTVDAGMTRDELSAVVSQGDSITFDVKCRRLAGERITAGALDDRCGVAAILLALDMLNGCSTRFNVIVNFSVQEEIGERGAKIGAFRLDPDYAIAVDVTFGLSDAEDAEKCGKMGEGAMIGISPCLDRELSAELIRTASSLSLPFQREVMNGLTSTNADRYSVSRNGAKVCTVSIPLRNMHTPAEVIDLRDVEYTAALIAGFIKEEV